MRATRGTMDLNSRMKALAKRTLAVAGLELRRLSSGERRRLDWLRNLRCRTVLDIGANTGQFAEFARELFPDADIHSFEPLPDCYAALEARVAGRPKFFTYPCALGETTAVAPMYRSNFTAASSLLPRTSRCEKAYPFTAGGDVVDIPVRRLDDVIAPSSLVPPLFVKVDVQGYELGVIAGGRRTIAAAHVLLVETSFERLYEGQPLFGDVLAVLSGLGFAYGGTLEHHLDPSDGRMLQADAVFLPKGSASSGGGQ
jgi:FkbM family methyltransferase